MARIKLAAVSLESRPGNKSANLDKIEDWSRKAVEQGARLVCFPAMAVTGHWQTSEVARHAEILKADLANPALVHPIGPSVKRLERLAEELGAWLAVGIIEDLDYYHLRNSVALLGPGGHLGTAAEVHTPVEPHPTYVAGRDCPIFKLDGVPAGILVGEDLYYPEVARMLTVQGAKLLIAAMATPVTDEPSAITEWRNRTATLLAARALENGVAVVGVEPAGTVHNTKEDADYHFAGQTMVFDAHGQLVGQTPTDNHETMLIAEVDVPNGGCRWLNRRRPALYRPLVAEEQPPEIPGSRQSDWDGQGELVWSRLRDLGFFCVDLYARHQADWKPGHQAVVVTTPTLPPLASYRTLLLTRPCLAQLPAEQAGKLSQWVTDGGTLILDGYCGRNQETLGPLTGVPGPIRREVYLPSYQDASRVTVRTQPAKDDAVFAGLEPHYRSKVWGQVWLPESDAGVTARPLACFISPQGENLGPALSHHPVGAGHVYTFAYSSGYSQLLLMQGRGTTRDLGSFPERVAPGAPPDGDVNTWGDQVVTDAEDQFFPSADYHLIPILNMMRAAAEVDVLVSPVPQGKECGVIFTGDSDRADAAQLNKYTDLLATRGVRPTLFLLRWDYKPKELRPDCEYAVHPLFHETDRACFDTLVSYGFDPAKLVCGRRHCLVQYGLTDTLERMAECGIRYTSNNWDFPYPETHSTAFLFGTTLPHHVYNWEGRRIGIVDFPQVFMDYQPVMECTQAAYRDVRRTHGIGAWNYHPQNLVIPGVKEAIEWLAAEVGRGDLWCGTMAEYGQWYEQRDRLVVTCDESGVTLQGQPPAGLTLLSARRDLTINGIASRGERTSSWYGRDYWVHVINPLASAVKPQPSPEE
jgi:predicted amidohydrolase